VVHNKIKNDPHSSCMRLCDESFHILDSTVRRIDILIVGNIVSHINLWRIVHGTDPYSINPDRSNVVQLRDYPIEIANAIAVGVFETGRIDLVYDTILPPLSFGDRHWCDPQKKDEKVELETW
jgi:hypothetical protein